MRGWKVIKNLLILWKYYYLMKRCESEIRNYGMTTMSVMDGLSEEEVEGMKTATELYHLLSIDPKKLKQDFKLLDQRVMRWDKKN